MGCECVCGWVRERRCAHMNARTNARVHVHACTRIERHVLKCADTCEVGECLVPLLLFSFLPAVLTVETPTHPWKSKTLKLEIPCVYSPPTWLWTASILPGVTMRACVHPSVRVCVRACALASACMRGDKQKRGHLLVQRGPSLLSSAGPVFCLLFCR